MDFKNRAPAIPDQDQVSDNAAEDSAENWTSRVKAFVLANEGELVGVTALRAEWFHASEEPSDLPWVIMIGAPTRGQADPEKTETGCHRRGVMQPGFMPDLKSKGGRARVVYRYKRPFWDGLTHVALEPLA